MLVAVEEKRHGVARGTSSRLEAPQSLAGKGVEGVDVAFVRAAEHEPPRRREQARPGRGQEAELPALLAGERVEPAHRSIGFFARAHGLAPAHEVGAGHVLRLALVVDRAHLAHGDVEEPRLRAVGRAEPVGGALQAGPGEGAFLARLLSGDDDGPSLRIEAPGPRLLRVGNAAQELAGRPVEDVVEGVAVGDEHELARSPGHLRVEQHRDLVGVPVVGVVGGELEVPAHAARLPVERHERAGVEVVAGTDVAIPVGAGVADAPIKKIQLGVVGAGKPGGPAARLPTVAAPGVVAGLAGAGDGDEPPATLARLRVVAVEKAPDARLAAAHADDHLARGCQGGRRDRVTQFVVAQAGRPPEGTREAVERHELRVESAHEDGAVEQGHPAVGGAEAQSAHVLRQHRIPPPEAPARARVEGHHGTARLGQVHHAVGHEGRRFEGSLLIRLVHPDRPQLRHVLGPDLVEGREALCVVGARVGEPRAGLGAGLPQTVVRDLGARARGDETSQGNEADPSHGSPRRLARNATRSWISLSVSTVL